MTRADDSAQSTTRSFPSTGKVVLVTCAGSTNALSIVKALRQQDEYEVRVIGVDLEDEASIAGSALCDEFHRVPALSEESAYIDALATLVERNAVDALFPILDQDVQVLGRHRDAFPPSVVCIPPQAAIEASCDKLETYAFFRRHGFATPRTCTPEDLARSELTFPLIAKPRRGNSSRHVYTIERAEELVLLERIEAPLLQELALGQELTIDLFGDGERVIAAVPRARLETRSGQVYKGRTLRDPLVIAEARRLGEALELRGPANVQGFRTSSEFLFTEINPRVSGGLPLTTAAGVNIPLLALKLAEGQQLQPIEDFAEVSMCRYWQEIIREVEPRG